MSDSPSLERRHGARLPLALTIELRDERGFSLHASSNLSPGGAFFDRAIPHAVGQKVQVSFRLPGDERPIACDGEVVNVPDKKSFGMGVRFIGLSVDDEKRLKVFTDQAREAE